MTGPAAEPTSRPEFEALLRARRCFTTLSCGSSVPDVLGQFDDPRQSYRSVGDDLPAYVDYREQLRGLRADHRGQTLIDLWMWVYKSARERRAVTSQITAQARGAAGISRPSSSPES